MSGRLASGGAIAALAMALAGCAVGPDYHRPSAPVTPAFKEAQGWRPGDPADGIDKGAWWSMFHDPNLDGLEQQVATSNQTVKQYEAAYRQAHAIVGEARAALFPTLGGAVSVDRSHGGSETSAAKPASSATTSSATGLLEASWVPDLWGRVRRTLEGDKALAQASAAELANARLSAQAMLAEDYFELRVLDEESDLYRRTTDDDQAFLTIVQAQYKEGTQPFSAVISARAQLFAAQSQAIALGASRAKMEHAIAVLTGRPPAELTLTPATLSRDVPVPPAGVPSGLLERRPDIAAAERQVAAANAQIGVATSAFFPDVTLSGEYGGAAGGLSGLFHGATSLWSIGANVAETLLDFGARTHQVAAARAGYDAQVANYRQTVLTAFEGVEDELATLRVYQQQEDVALAAEADARKAVELDVAEYKEGAVDYATVLSAQTTALSASQTVLTALLQRLQASVLLVEDLGGGWSAADLPKA